VSLESCQALLTVAVTQPADRRGVGGQLLLERNVTLPETIAGIPIHVFSLNACFGISL
jgi:hypothetical protein